MDGILRHFFVLLLRATLFSTPLDWKACEIRVGFEILLITYKIQRIEKKIKIRGVKSLVSTLIVVDF